MLAQYLNNMINIDGTILYLNVTGCYPLKVLQTTISMTIYVPTPHYPVLGTYLTRTVLSEAVINLFSSYSWHWLCVRYYIILPSVPFELGQRPRYSIFTSTPLWYIHVKRSMKDGDNIINIHQSYILIYNKLTIYTVQPQGVSSIRTPGHILYFG